MCEPFLYHVKSRRGAPDPSHTNLACWLLSLATFTAASVLRWVTGASARTRTQSEYMIMSSRGMNLISASSLYLRSTISWVLKFFSTPIRLFTMQWNIPMSSTVALLNFKVRVLFSNDVTARWLKSLTSWFVHHTSSRSNGFPLTEHAISASVPFFTVTTFVMVVMLASSAKRPCYSRLSAKARIRETK